MAVIIFKALETCNANCVYCEVVKKNVREIMNYSLLKTVFKKMGDYLKEYPKETISFIWHGGEVALLGADYFQKAYEIVHFIWHWTLGNWNEKYKNGEKPSGMSLKKEHFPFTYKVTKYAL